MLSSAIQTQTQAQISEDLFPSEAHAFITRNEDSRDLKILDVCTPNEFVELHLENAVNLNFFSRGFKDRLNALDKNKTYFVYCKVGGRSKLVQKLMKKLGFREVYNIMGGTLLWEEEGLPFASGSEGPGKFSLCPIFISITLMKKLRKSLQTGNVALSNAIFAAGFLKKSFRYRPAV